MTPIKGGGGTDELFLGSGVDSGDITLHKDGNNLLIKVNDGRTITLVDQYVNVSSSYIHAVETFDSVDLLTAMLGINNIPQAANDAVSGNEDAVITGNVLSNNGSGADSDPESDPLTVTAASFATSHGMVSILANGNFTYTPTANYSGTDSFYYEVSDGNGGVDTATMTLTVNAVNDAPVLTTNSGASFEQDTTLTLTTAMLSASDIDNTNAQIAFTISTLPAHGAVKLSGVALGLTDSFTRQDVIDGLVTFVPTSAYVGSDSFGFVAGDGTASLSAANFSMTITSSNDAPTLTNNGGSTTHGTALTLTTAMLSLTDTDNTATQLEFAVQAAPAHGTLTLNGVALGVNDSFTKQNIIDGLVRYTPTLGYVGSDDFDFIAGDGIATLSSASFALTVTTTLNVVNGTASGETLTGTSGADLMVGNGGSDIYNTGNGNDVIVGGSGFDDVNPSLYSYSGNKTVYGLGGGDRIATGSGSDIVYGGDGDDSINAFGGNNTVYAGNGDDYAQGGAGNDTLYGESGIDYLYGHIGYDIMYGGDGDDVLYGSHSSGYSYMLSTYGSHSGGTKEMYGDAGADILYGYFGNDILTGGAGNDTLYGDTGDDVYKFNLGDGMDTINDAGGTTDKIRFGPGITLNNLIFTNVSTYNTEITFDGYAGDKITIVNQRNGSTYKIDKIVLDGGAEYAFPLVGGSGNDTLTGTSGADLFYGNGGTNSYNTGNGDDVIIGGPGVDDINYTFYSYSGNKTVYTGDGNDRVAGGSGNDLVYTGSGDDVINAFNGNNTLYAEDGDDYAQGGSGVDLIYGGAGSDFLYGHIGNDKLYGGDSADTLYGSHSSGQSYMNTLYGSGHTPGSKELYGEAGNDTLYGYIGSDILVGGTGADLLHGDSGADAFVFETAALGAGVDTIDDFNKVSGDTINLADLLEGYDPMQHAIADFVSISVASSHTTIKVDRDGTGGTYSAQDVVVVNSTTWSNVSDMISSGDVVID